MSVCIRKEDVIKLILQFLKENSFLESFKTLQEESGVQYNIITEFSKFKQDLLQGEWSNVLKSLQHVQIKTSQLFKLYHSIIVELLLLNEKQTAYHLLQTFPNPSQVQINQLNSLFEQSVQIIYDSKIERESLFSKLQTELIDVQPSRLLQLLGKSLEGINQPFYDILTGKNFSPNIPIQTIDKIISTSRHLECAVFSKEHLILGYSEGTIEVWDPINYQLRKDDLYQKHGHFMRHEGIVKYLSISDNNLASADGGAVIKIWRLTTGKMFKKEILQEPVSAILLTPYSIFIAGREVIYILGLQSGRRSIAANMINCMKAFGNYLIASSMSGMLIIFYYKTMQRVRQIQIENLAEIMILSENQIVCKKNEDILIVDDKLKLIRTLNLPEKTLQIVAITNSEKFIYALASNSVLYCFKIENGVLVNQLQINESEILGIIFHQSLNLLFAFTRNQRPNLIKMIFIK